MKIDRWHPTEKIAAKVAVGDILLNRLGQPEIVKKVCEKGYGKYTEIVTGDDNSSIEYIFMSDQKINTYKKKLGKKLRYGLLTWLGKKLGAPVKRV